jgi:O-methyltransferase involved in polyketide biosynthesis
MARDHRARREPAEPVGPTANRVAAVRVRWFDDLVTGLAADIRQVVSLGAGPDTRPFRLDLPPDLHWFEVHLAGAWATRLLAAEFRPGAATLWVAEGLLVHLGEEAVLTLLRTTAELSGPGSRFAADVMGFRSGDPGALLAAGGWRIGLIDLPAGTPGVDGALVVGAR